MVSIGVLYTSLAYYGMRSGAHWARQTLMISAAIGFASFFLFLGFGYFDPLHAVVSLLPRMKQKPPGKHARASTPEQANRCGPQGTRRGGRRYIRRAAIT